MSCSCAVNSVEKEKDDYKPVVFILDDDIPLEINEADRELVYGRNSNVTGRNSGGRNSYPY